MPIKTVPQNHPLFPTRPADFPKPRQMQRVVAVIDLRLDDSKIDRDAQTLENLQRSVRTSILRPASRKPLADLPTLYKKYRSTAFPLHKPNGSKVQEWRQLSPWMKTQIASLCIIERMMMVFRVHLHDEVALRLHGSAPDTLRRYFRDRFSRCLREVFGVVPFFWMVIENRNASGESSNRPHIHGEIEIRRATLPILRNGLAPIASLRIIKSHGLKEAELRYGREVTRDAISRATGNEPSSTRYVHGRDQRRNMWWRSPYRIISNHDHISYAFKNVSKISRRLGGKRSVMSLELNQEAQKLWQLLRLGEPAVSQWL